MKYNLKDGGVIDASTPREFVTKLRESSRFDSECTDEQYMKNFADRFKIQTGIEIENSSPEAFLEALKKTEYITDIC